MKRMTFKKFVIPELTYGVSEKSDGSMRLWGDSKQDAQGVKNRRVFFSRKGIPIERTMSLGLMHGTKIYRATGSDAGKRIEGYDAAITKERNIFLTITVADCFPLYAIHPKTNTVAVAHVGWRGIIRGLVPSLIKAMQSSGARLDELLVSIGPGIRACHFEVQSDVLREFEDYRPYIHWGNKTFIDLERIIMHQLIHSGIIASHIETAKVCTYCETSKYFSFRRDKPQVQEAMVAYIGVKS